MTRTVLMAALAIAAAATLLGQSEDSHPNNQVGFAPERVYNVHDLDSVNAFNGNLVVRIPIGLEYTVNGRLPHGLALTYNSHCWRYVVTPSQNPLQKGPDVTGNPDGELSGRTTNNAGMGWRLSIGSFDGSSYIGSDGATHGFVDDLHATSVASAPTRYTRDGSYLRLRVQSATGVLVDFPDGTTYTFQQLQPILAPGTGTWQSSSSSGLWFLTQMDEPFGNEVTITYRTAAGYKEIWEIADPARTTTVYFTAGLTADFNTTLDHIDTKAVNGTTATYSFSYQTTDVPPPAGDTTNRTSVPIPVLTGITLPTGNGYSMMADGQPAYDHSLTTPGVLTRLVLPTLGSIGWSYDIRDFSGGFTTAARSPAVDIPVVVRSRMNYDAAGNLLGTWSYGERFSEQVSCPATCQGANGTTVQCTSGRSRQLTTWVTEPPTEASSDVRTTISYFSSYEHIPDNPGGDTCTTPEGWLQAEHGLPFTRYASRDGRFLSTEIRSGFDAANLNWSDGKGQVPASGTTVRETYVTYDLDCDATTDMFGFHKNPMVSSTATYFDDDHSCGSMGSDVCYAATNNLAPDGYGHYRQASADGNFRGPDGTVQNGGNYRTTFTNYNPGSGYAPPSACTMQPASPWVLNTSTETCVVDETSHRTSAVSTCDVLPNAFITKTQYQGASGALTARRVLRQSGGVLDAADVLTTFAYDPLGNLSAERYFGGDMQALSPDNTFETPDPPAYAITHALQYSVINSGILIRDTATYANGVIASDESYDTSTGLVTSTYDISGLQTTYSYDLLGRVTGMTPPGVAATSYVYSDASAAAGVFTPAKIAATADGTSSGIGVFKKEYKYDPFGRLWRAKSLLKDGVSWSIVQNDFDVLGRRTATSMPETLTVPESSFSPAHKATYTSFDAVNRPRRVTAPDGTYTTFAYSGIRKTTRTATIPIPAGTADAVVVETRDPLGRLVQVTELSGSTSLAVPVGTPTNTNYVYDSGNHLTSATTVSETVTQQRRFFYDHRGFLIQEQHPELGANSIAYVYTSPAGAVGYDARGHARGKLIGSINGLTDLRFTFDPSERLSAVYDHGDQQRAVKVFSYWSGNDGATPPNLAKGKLYQAIRYNHLPSVSGDVVVTETYTYATPEGSGRISKRDTVVENVNGGTRTTLQAFSQNFHYDSFGASAQIDYPKCGDSVPCGGNPAATVPLTRRNGFLAGVGTSGAYASAIGYNPDGSVNSVARGPNGSLPVDTYAPDPYGMPRPQSITFSGLCSGPVATVSGGGTISPGGSATVQAALTGVAPWTVTWSDGFTQTVSASPATHTVSPTTTTQYTVTTLRDATSCAGSATGTATVTVNALSPPGGVTAQTQANTLFVAVSWSAVSGAGWYQVERATRMSSNDADWQPVGGHITATSYTDQFGPTPTPITYLYRVRSGTGTNTVSSASALDYATVATTLFSDEPLAIGSTIRGIHLGELRQAIDKVRYAALLPPAWTSYAAASGRIAAADNLEARAKLDEAVSILVGHAVPYTGETPAANGLIRAYQLQQIRDGVR